MYKLPPRVHTVYNTVPVQIYIYSWMCTCDYTILFTRHCRRTQCTSRVIYFIISVQQTNLRILGGHGVCEGICVERVECRKAQTIAIPTSYWVLQAMWGINIIGQILGKLTFFFISSEQKFPVVKYVDCELGSIISYMAVKHNGFSIEKIDFILTFLRLKYYIYITKFYIIMNNNTKIKIKQNSFWRIMKITSSWCLLGAWC